MQIWRWLILSVAFLITSSYCSAFSLQSKNQTEHLASEPHLANVTGYQQGHFENSTKSQGLGRNNFNAPLDPLSRSFSKVKKDERRQRKMPQKQPGQKGLVEQMMPRENTNFKIQRAGDKIQFADNVESSPMHQPSTKPNGRMDVLMFERNSRVSKKRGRSGTFGLPIDRIGHVPYRKG